MTAITRAWWAFPPPLFFPLVFFCASITVHCSFGKATLVGLVSGKTMRVGALTQMAENRLRLLLCLSLVSKDDC